MKYSTEYLVQKHTELQATAYSPRRNSSLERVQRALEARGIFNAGGTLRQPVTAQSVQGFQVLSVGGGK